LPERRSRKPTSHNCPRFSGIPVPELLKSLSANYRNRCPGIAETRNLAYVTKDQAETSVLFALISARYERRSMLVTANQPFGECSPRSIASYITPQSSR